MNIYIESVKIELNEKAFGRIYQYNDDNTSVYFEGIKVDIAFRRQGLGTILLQMLELFGKCLGASYSYLWVEKNTWIYEWYKRNGYSYFKDHEDVNFIWMSKIL